MTSSRVITESGFTPGPTVGRPGYTPDLLVAEHHRTRILTMRDRTHENDAAREQSDHTYERDLTTQYGNGEEQMTLVHDTENERARVQSDYTVEVTE